MIYVCVYVNKIQLYTKFKHIYNSLLYQQPSKYINKENERLQNKKWLEINFSSLDTDLI